MNKPLLHRREALILTSIEVINDCGIQGFTTRELARREGISEGAIFKHFRSKNELMLAILDYYSQFDADILDSIKLKNYKPVEAIIFLISAYAEYYQNYPAITTITQAYDVLYHDPKLTDKIKHIYTSRVDSMEALIAKAQNAGELSPSVDSKLLSHVIWGSCSDICLKWRFCEYGFSLKQYVMDAIEMILNAFAL